MLLLSKLNYRGDWYLLRAKFTNDWNFFVLEVGRGTSGMEECSLEIGEVLWGEEGDDGDRKQVYTYFGKSFAKVYLVCLIMSLSSSLGHLQCSNFNILHYITIQNFTNNYNTCMMLYKSNNTECIYCASCDPGSGASISNTCCSCHRCCTWRSISSSSLSFAVPFLCVIVTINKLHKHTSAGKYSEALSNIV